MSFCSLGELDAEAIGFELVFEAQNHQFTHVFSFAD